MDTTNITFQVPSPGTTNLYFQDAVDSDSAATFVKDFTKLTAELENIEAKTNNKFKEQFDIPLALPKYPINIHLSTPGGICYNGFAIYSYINNVAAKRPIYITGSGLIASMGIIILLSVPLKYRCAYADTTFMIHQVSSCAWGKLADIKESVEEAERLNDKIFDIIVNNTKITKEQLQECYTQKKDWFMSAQEALEVGLISEIL